ncbi:hypothetical protein SAMD00079811_79090 (plasmid) [Scytonema sp. HK-05]|nr:hypothetical protein SAMD00079811_79090 [Scytonema sp. HK-05]
MSFQIKNNQVEMSEQELDSVAGGLDVSLGNVGNFTQDSASNFKATNFEIQDFTTAGPGGASTGTAAELQQTQSNALNNIIAHQ